MEPLARDLELEESAHAIIRRLSCGSIESKRPRKAIMIVESDGSVLAKIGPHRYARKHNRYYKNRGFREEVEWSLRHVEALNMLGEFTSEEYIIMCSYKMKRQQASNALRDKHELERLSRRYNIELPEQLAFRNHGDNEEECE